MPSLLAVLATPIALDGDSALGNGAAIAVLGLITMVGGYLILAALWWFVFRQRPEDRVAEREAQQARDEAHEAGRDPALHGRRLQIERSPSPRFRRR